MSKLLDDLKYQYRIGGVVQKLILWNVLISVLVFVLQVFFPTFSVSLLAWLALHSEPVSLLYKPWTLLTYSFIHAGVIHLLFNMLVLFFVGRLFSTLFTEKQFLTLYILGAFLGGVFFILGGQVMRTGSVLVGASAATIAPLVGIAVHAPLMKVRLALLGNVKLWHIAVLILLLDLIQLNTGNTGGHLAHLGGAFMGFIYIKLLVKGVDLSIIFEKVTTVFKPRKKRQFKKVYVNNRKLKESGELGEDLSDKQKKTDTILDKISKSGYESLTKAEKDFLFSVGKK